MRRDEPGARARLVRRAVFVLFGVLVGLAAGVAISSAQQQRYESTMQLLVGPVGADRSTLDAAGLLSRTYADLLSSRNAVNRAADSLGVTVEDGDVRAIADDKSRVILLVVTGDDPTNPPRLATTLAADLIVLVEGSQQQSDNLAVTGPAPGQVRVLDDATDPAQPVSSRSILTLLGTSILGGGVGLALGGLAPRSRRRPVDRQYLELLGLDVFSLQHVTSRRRRLFRRKPAKQVANKLDEYELIFQQLVIKGIQLGQFRSMLFVPVTEDLEDDVARLVAVLALAGHRLSCSVVLSDLDPDRRLLTAIDPALGLEIIDPLDLNTESGVKRIARVAESSDSKLLFLVAPAVGKSVRALTAVPAVDRIVPVVRSGRTERRDVRTLLDDLDRLNSKPTAVLELDGGELIMATSLSTARPRLDADIAVIGDVVDPASNEDVRAETVSSDVESTDDENVSAYDEFDDDLDGLFDDDGDDELDDDDDDDDDELGDDIDDELDYLAFDDLYDVLDDSALDDSDLHASALAEDEDEDDVDDGDDLDDSDLDATDLDVDDDTDVDDHTDTDATDLDDDDAVDDDPSSDDGGHGQNGDSALTADDDRRASKL